MADINFETHRLATLMAEVNRQMQEYGTVTKETQSKVFDANMKLKYGVDNATQSISKAGEAVGHLTKAAADIDLRNQRFHHEFQTIPRVISRDKSPYSQV
jgi:hypothetical protein